MTDRLPDPPLHALDPTGRFTVRAADYARWRPTYADAAIDAVLEGLGPPERLRAADVGAGTGISARLLARRGVRTAAVEPNAAMREAAEPHPLVRWVDGTAERTGLYDASLDLVLCAQSFHWFRAEEAIAEFARVLRPGGRVALMWNARDDADPAAAEFSRLVVEASGGDPAARGHVSAGGLLVSPRLRDARESVHSHVVHLDVEGLVGRALSASYVPREGPPRDRLVAGLRALAARFAGPDGLVAMAHVTRVYLAETESR